jgi:hypothetical protein
VSKEKPAVKQSQGKPEANSFAETKFITLLSTFSGNEITEFSKFLESPYNNRKGPYILKAFGEIRKFHPDYTRAEFTKEKIFRSLYGSKPYNDVLLRKIISELQKLAEDFLGSVPAGEFDFAKELRLLSAFRKRRLDKLFEKKYAEVSRYLGDPAGKVNKDYFRSQYDMEIEGVNYELIKDRQEKTFEGLKKIQQHITYDFLINILDIQYNLMIGNDTSFRNEYNFITELIKHIDFNDLKKFLKKNTSEQYPIFEIFYYRWLSYLEGENEENYYRLKGLILKHLDYFNREEKFTMLIALQNNAIHKARAGKYEFHKEVFNVNRIMIEKGLYAAADDENMQLSTFRNIFITARNVKENKWSEWFVENYISKLDPDKRENTYHFSRALIEFADRNYDKATNELQKLKYEHFMHKIDAQLLLLKIYYETRAFESALSLIDNLKHYYRDMKKVSATYRKNNEPFLKYLQRIILFRLGNEKGKRDELINTIQNAKVLDKYWLIDKLNELKP